MDIEGPKAMERDTREDRTLGGEGSECVKRHSEKFENRLDIRSGLSLASTELGLRVEIYIFLPHVS